MKDPALTPCEKMAEEYVNLYSRTNPRDVYPSELLVRIFMGRYPQVPRSFFQGGFTGKSILDLGFGDGRNTRLFQKLGMLVSGTEIEQRIVKHVSNALDPEEQFLRLQVGYAHAIPFESALFDYVVAWNSCYYMGDYAIFNKFEKHVEEMARVCKQGGFLLVSVPMKSHSIFQGCVPLSSESGYVTITNDPNEARNGTVFRMFRDAKDVQNSFLPDFTPVSDASVTMSFFGYKLDWHILILRRN